MFNAARTLAAASDTFDALAAQLRKNDPQCLRIGAPPYTKALPERREMIDLFTTRFPGTRIELQTGWSLNLQTMLRAGSIDIALGVIAFDPDFCDGLLLRELQLSLSVAQDHPFARRGRVEPSDLSGQTVHVFTRSLNPVLWDEFYAPLRTAGANLVERPEVAEGGAEHMAVMDTPAAFLHLGNESSSSTTSSVLVECNSRAPLYLLRRKNDLAPSIAAMWDIGTMITVSSAGRAEARIRKD
ncbi:MAG: LysR substrate-binding domain-containing protein [Novosphingobium sp.]